MKKRLSFLAMAFFAVLSASAQMFAYKVKTTTTAYEAITNGIVVDLGGYTGTEFSNLLLDADGNQNFNAAEDVTAFPIGFDFEYNSKTMKYFLIGTNGEVLLSPEETITTDIHTNSGANLLSNNNYADFFGISSREGYYGLDDTEISYKTEGEAGNRVLVIQYKNFDLCGTYNADKDYCGAKANIQYRLFEKTGNLQIKVSGFKPVATGTYNFIRLGIVGDKGDRLLVTSYDGQSYGTSTNSITYSADSYPADGTTYTFEAPDECMTPGGTLQNLVLTSTTTQISGSFKTSDADHYLVLAGTAAPEGVQPVDKTKYAVGDELGNAKVIAVVAIYDDQLNYNEAPTFKSPNNMEPNTEYSVTLIPYNSLGMGGPLYGEATTATIKTKPAAPTSLAVTGATKNTITLALEGSSPAVVMMSDEAEVNMVLQVLPNGLFPQVVEGTYKVGQDVTFDYEKYIESWSSEPATGTVKVVYVGDSADAIEVTGLETGKDYYFRAWSTDGTGNYSSEYVETATVTASELPWAFEMKNFGGFDPVGWTKSADGVWSANTRAANPYFYSQANGVTADNPITTWIESPVISLGSGTNTLTVSLAATEIPVRFASDWHMAEDDVVAVQLTTDGVNYKDILLINSENQPAVEADEEMYREAGNYWVNGLFHDYEVDFTEFAGQDVRLRIYIHRQSNGQVQVANLALANKPAEANEATVTYAIKEGDTFTSGQTVDVKDADNNVVATITYGEAGGDDFKAAKANGAIEGFVAFTEGNDINGNKLGGTFYTIKPKYDGEIEVGVVLNASKAFYVVEDGTALDEYNGKTVNEKYYGTYTFSVKAGKSYKLYCAGSKLGFYGFNYTYDLTATGIESAPVVTVKSDAVYNLQGQRMTTLVPGKLYIKNGRKFIAR